MPTLAALDDATIEAAGLLVASEHTAARRAHLSLPVAWTDPQVCTGALRRLLDTGHRGAVAIEGGRALAVLTGTGRGTPSIYSPGGTQSVEALVEEHLALREAGATPSRRRAGRARRRAPDDRADLAGPTAVPGGAALCRPHRHPRCGTRPRGRPRPGRHRADLGTRPGRGDDYRLGGRLGPSA